MENYSIIQIVQILIGAFLGVAMVQSGVDKITDWKGNHNWLVSHFSNSFLAPFVTSMLGTVTALETVGGLLLLFGAGNGLIYGDTYYVLCGLLVIAINLLALFFGQRIAKDYEGAAVLVNYFILTIIGLLTFHN
jgi:uncharacterized membrane protein YphA (DoxX/SURF4 family)